MLDCTIMAMFNCLFACTVNEMATSCSPHRHKSGKGGLHNKCVLSLIKVLCFTLKVYAEDPNEG